MTIRKSWFAHALLFAVIFIFLQVLAPFDVTTNMNIDETSDYLAYRRIFELLDSAANFSALLALVPWEPGFAFLFASAALAGLNFEDFIHLQATFLAFAYYILAVTVLHRKALAAVATFAYTLTPFFASFSIVVIRQSVSCGLLFLALAALMAGRNQYKYVLLGLSMLTHASGVLFAIAAFTAVRSRLKHRTVRFAIIAVLTLYVGFVAHLVFTPLLIAVIETAGISMSATTYTVGTKLAFLGATAATLGPALLMRGADAPRYFMLFRFCLLVSLAYMVASGLPYHDRLAIVSWSLIPIMGLGALTRFRIFPARPALAR